MKMNTVEELKAWQGNGVTAGFVPDLNIDLYHHPECPGWSKTALDKIEDSPAALKHYKSEPPEPKDWGTWGNAVHTAILEPDLFLKKYTHLPEFFTVDKKGVKETVPSDFVRVQGKELRESALAEGKICLRYLDYQWAIGAREAARQHKFAKRFLFEGEAIVEGSAFWVNSDTGLLCKTRPDRFRKDGVIAEIKTTEDASERGFQKSLDGFRYNVQGAFQIDGMKECMGWVAEYFCIVAIEKKPPFHINVFPVHKAALEVGRKQYKRNLETIRLCTNKNEWPALSTHYRDELIVLDLPQYRYDEESRLP